MTQLTKDLIMERIADIPLSETLQKNKTHFANSLIKHKNCQRLICLFTDEITKLLNTELNNEHEAKLVSQYLETPNIQPSSKLPTFNQELVQPLVVSHLTKAKQYIAKLEEQNKLERER